MPLAYEQFTGEGANQDAEGLTQKEILETKIEIKSFGPAAPDKPVSEIIIDEIITNADPKKTIDIPTNLEQVLSKDDNEAHFTMDSDEAKKAAYIRDNGLEAYLKLEEEKKNIVNE